MEAQTVVALVIGIVVVLLPALVWATVMASMGEVLRWLGDFIGIIAIIQRWSRTGLYQIVQHKIRESLKAIAQREVTSTK
jgi:Na+/H+ antiporter NhaD/arsenite permease-like protein